MTPKDPFWRGLSGTSSGGRFAPGALLFTPDYWGIQVCKHPALFCVTSWGPFQAISGNFWQFSGDFMGLGPFQAISGNSRQF